MPRPIAEQERASIEDAIVRQAPRGMSDQEFDRWYGPRYAQAVGEIDAHRGAAVRIHRSGTTEVRALGGVDVDFAAGRFTAIMGPSGSGKSTLMHCLAGLDTLTSGTVCIGSTDLGTLDERGLTRLRRDHIGFVFQSFNLVPTLTVEENITLPSSLAGTAPDPNWLATGHHSVGTRRVDQAEHHRDAGQRSPCRLHHEQRRNDPGRRSRSTRSIG